MCDGKTISNNKTKYNLYGVFAVREGAKRMDTLSLILIIIGALNWGSIGIFGFDIVGALFGGQLSVFSRIIFTIVGLGGLWAISFFFKEKIMNKKEA